MGRQSPDGADAMKAPVHEKSRPALFVEAARACVSPTLHEEDDIRTDLLSFEIESVFPPAFRPVRSIVSISKQLRCFFLPFVTIVLIAILHFLFRM